MDVVSRQKRQEMMANIRGQNTKPERLIRSGLHMAGLRFRLHRRDLPGRPDIVLPRFRVCIFVNGCFWHCHDRCSNATFPKTNQEFWRAKLLGNVARDKRNIAELLSRGWRVLVIWECVLRTPDSVAQTVAETFKWIHESERFGVIPSLDKGNG